MLHVSKQRACGGQLLTIGILIQVVSFGLIGSASAAPQAQPSEIYLKGIIRDFRKDHSDFGYDGAAATGHVAGNVLLDMSASGKPSFSGSGYRVNSQWLTLGLDPIAPHLSLSATTIPLAGAPTLDAGASSDTWDSSIGGYLAQPAGPAPGYKIGGFMPSISEPSPFIANTGNQTYDSSKNAKPQNRISSDIHCDTFSTQQNTLLVIDGNVTILCEVDFLLDQNTHITLTPGSTLELYVKRLFLVSQSSSLNMPPDNPSSVMIYNLGTTQMEINQSSAVCAMIFSPNAGLHLAQGDQFYGKFIGQTIQQDMNSEFHWDIRPWRDACSNIIDDIEGSAGLNSQAGIASSVTFDTWFRDVLGTNLSTQYLIKLVRDVNGLYEYQSTEFYPIDDMMFGNEGDPHNSNFTFEATFGFTYQSCQNQFFEFSGSDEVYVYINGQLVIDIGGIMNGQRQVVELDRLGLVVGNSYQAIFFYANRNSMMGDMSINTNVEIDVPAMILTASAAFD